jgi:hypothetical protein
MSDSAIYNWLAEVRDEFANTPVRVLRETVRNYGQLEVSIEMANNLIFQLELTKVRMANYYWSSYVKISCFTDRSTAWVLGYWKTIVLSI